MLIPARGGSKGLPGKNIKALLGKPLINYTLEFAEAHFDKTQICVSSDDKTILEKVSESGFLVPFVRPNYLATDNTGIRDVMLHAVDVYEKQGVQYKYILLLQPTSPIRSDNDLKNLFNVASVSSDFDMIVSVKETDSNPYFNLFEEDEMGHLRPSKKGLYERRQDCPKIYEYNGAFYLINIESLKESSLRNFSKVFKLVITGEINNIDIDTIRDWKKLESLLLEVTNGEN